MIPWQLIDSTTVPGEGKPMRLYRRGEEFSIKVGHCELMNSRLHGSEDALAECACQRLRTKQHANILIGGLGMGFTLAAALKQLDVSARVTVAELVPAVITWNKTALASLAGEPLTDHRVNVHEGDVNTLIRGQNSRWDAILLDVDNGPEGLTREGNHALYSMTGLHAAAKALRPGGIFGVWSITPEPMFTRRMQKAGFKTETLRVPSRGQYGGSKHTIWLGRVSQ